MSVVAVIGVAVLLGAGTWLLLDRDLVRTTLGSVLLGHGVVLLLVGMRPGGAAPVIGEDGALPGGGDVVGGGVADPIPQALALTAIVISFGVTAFLLALAERARRDARDAASVTGVVDAPVEGKPPAGLGDEGEMDDEAGEAEVAEEEAAGERRSADDGHGREVPT